MDISKVLLDRAILNIWENPSEDNRVVIKANRISSENGNFKYVEIDLFYYQLPNNTRRFDLFELGKLDISQIGLPNECYNQWLSLSTLINIHQTNLKIINNKKLLSLANGFVMNHPDGNILIALDHNSNSDINLVINDVYVQFYACVCYRNGKELPINRLRYFSYVHDVNNDDIIYNTFSNTFENINKNKTLFFNGIRLDAELPSYYNLKPNDTLLYYVEPLIVFEQSTLVSDLGIFNSTLDSCEKYIFSIETNHLFFIDDIDFYVTIRLANKDYGLFIPKVNLNYFRMLTYKEFSINKSIIDEYVISLGEFLNIDDLSNIKLVAKFRDTKSFKGNFKDNDKIYFLTKLPQDIRLRVINGDLSSLVPFWNADSLESNKFNTWISNNSDYILDENNINHLYSYHSSIEILERLYKKRGETNWRLPPLLSNFSGNLVTFDVDGYLDSLTFLNHQNRNDNTIVSDYGYEYVLPFTPDEFNIDKRVLPNIETTILHEVGIGFTCYYNDVSNVLTLLIRDTDYTVISDGLETTITWDVSVLDKPKYIRMSNRGVLIQKTVLIDDIHIPIDLYDGRLGNNAYYDIGFGYIYVWCNGKYLIEGLDYAVVEGKFRLFKIIKQVEVFDFNIIYTGTPDEELTHVLKGTWGWVINGKIECNYQYDLYGNSNKLYFVDGSIKDVSELYTEEPFELNDLVILDDTEPYEIPIAKPFAVVPYPKFLDEYELLPLVYPLSNENTKNGNIKDLLEVVYPIVPDESLMIINDRYLVCSLLMDKLIDDIDDGTLIITGSDHILSEINTILIPYQEYKEKDVAFNNHDTRFLEIHPRLTQEVITITEDTFTFLDKVNKLVLGGRVSSFNLYLNIVI